MVKKILLFSLAALFVMGGFASLSMSSTEAPAEMELTSSTANKKPPAKFPHKMHQDAMECGECHHGMKDGKQTPFVEGMEIKKCESCHNSEVLAGKTKGKLKLDTFKGAGHGNCLECHKAVAKKDKSKKALKSCKTCHVKK